MRIGSNLGRRPPVRQYPSSKAFMAAPSSETSAQGSTAWAPAFRAWRINSTTASPAHVPRSSSRRCTVCRRGSALTRGRAAGYCVGRCPTSRRREEGRSGRRRRVVGRQMKTSLNALSADTSLRPRAVAFHRQFPVGQNNSRSAQRAAFGQSGAIGFHGDGGEWCARVARRRELSPVAHGLAMIIVPPLCDGTAARIRKSRPRPRFPVSRGIWRSLRGHRPFHPRLSRERL